MNRTLFIFILLSTHSFGQSIFDLARSGDEIAMKKLLDEKPNQVNALSDQGLSPFLLAAYRGNNEVAKLLIERGADIHSCFAEGSAIYGVIYKNNLDILDFMLQKDLNVNDTCQFNQFGTPLDFAMSLRRYEVIERLLKCQVELKMTDQNGKTINELLVLYNDDKLIKLFKSYEK